MSDDDEEEEQEEDDSEDERWTQRFKLWQAPNEKNGEWKDGIWGKRKGLYSNRNLKSDSKVLCYINLWSETWTWLIITWKWF